MMYGFLHLLLSYKKEWKTFLELNGTCRNCQYSRQQQGTGASLPQGLGLSGQHTATFSLERAARFSLLLSSASGRRNVPWCPAQPPCPGHTFRAFHSFLQNVCNTLWCSVGNTCHSKLDAAVDGTKCDEKKVFPGAWRGAQRTSAPKLLPKCHFG